MAAQQVPGGGSVEVGASTTFVNLVTLNTAGVTNHAALAVLALMNSLYCEYFADSTVQQSKQATMKKVMVDGVEYAVNHIGKVAWPAGSGFTAADYETFQLSIYQNPNLPTRSRAWSALIPYNQVKKINTTNVPHQLQP
jgi:hypothetical protein